MPRPERLSAVPAVTDTTPSGWWIVAVVFLPGMCADACAEHRHSREAYQACIDYYEAERRDSLDRWP